MKKQFLIPVIALGLASSAAGLYALGYGLPAIVTTSAVASTVTSPEDSGKFNLSLNTEDMTAEIIAADDVVNPYEGDIEIPSLVTVDGKTYTVVSIGYMAFRDSDITSVKLPATIREIKQAAFQNTRRLESVQLNDGLSTLNWDVFSATPMLKSIEIPGTVKEIPSGAFSNSGIAKLVINEGVEVIEDAFNYCNNLTDVTLPNTVTDMDACFRFCSSLSKLELPTSLRNIGTSFIEGTLISEIEIPEGVGTLGMRSIGNMNGTNNASTTLKKIILPSSLSSIHYMALNNLKGIEEVVFNGSGENLVITGTYASFLSACPIKDLTLGRKLVDASGNDITSFLIDVHTTLATLTIPEGVTTVPSLTNCANLRTINLLTETPPAAEGFHQNAYYLAKVNVPGGTAGAYAQSPVWSSFSNIVAAKAKSDIDVEKLKYTIGEGANLYAVEIRFGNAERLDNLVLGYRTDENGVYPPDVIREIAAADKRMEVEIGSTGISHFGFDLTGDGVIDIKDALADSGEETKWITSMDYLTSDGNHNVITLSYGPQAEKAPYHFYLPSQDEKGVWVPEEMTVRLADDVFVLPVLVQPQGETVTSTTNWRASSKNTAYLLDRTVILTPYSFLDGSYHARPTLVGTTGTTYVEYRPMIGGVYYDSNYMTLNVVEPERPITQIVLASDSLKAGLNKSVELEYSYLPEDASYTALKVVSSDTKVATWTQTAGVKTTTVAGTTTLTVSSVCNPEVNSTCTLTSELINPVTNVHFGKGTDETGVIDVPIRQLFGLKPIVEPADADIPDVNVELLNNGTSKDDYTCTVYKVNWWDINNVRTQFYELSGHRPTGDNPATVRVTSADGAFTRDFKVVVGDQDRTPRPQGYVDGTIILNEEWYGHTNGGLNYITEDDEIIYQAYERENPGMSFGATSQFGTIWADKLIVVSKQAVDRGDVLPGGGRLVIADAATLKRIGSLDEFVWDGQSGDGRAVAGATPEKIYVSTSNGIYIVSIADPENPVVTGRIGMDADSTNLYAGQTGDMINAGKYVFGVQQSKGLVVIDSDTDEAKLLEDANIQGVTQSADGNVWYCTLGVNEAGSTCSVFVAINPETLEEVERVNMPASIGTVVCGWGAWRSTAFKGDLTRNCLWFVTGGASIMGGASGDYYCYHIGDNPENIAPFFTLSNVTGINDFGEEVGQMTYGTPLYDDRNDRLIVMAGRKGAASGGYRDHWIHLVDGSTGEIEKTLQLNPYYWFQSLPIIPDKYAAEFELGDIELQAETKTLDLATVVSDADSRESNIRYSIESAISTFDDEIEEVGAPAEISLEGSILTIVPKGKGTMPLTINAQSNGHVSSHTINLIVDNTTGVNAIAAGNGITYAAGRLYVRGYEGVDFSIYDVNGIRLGGFTPDEADYIFDFGQHAGIYVVKGSNGLAIKLVVK